MQLESGKSYIQKNPLLRRKVLYVERLRESVWGWNLCDITLVRLEDAPEIEHQHSLASSVYDNQGLEEIPLQVFQKILSIARLYEASAKAAGCSKLQPLANETLARCLRLLADDHIIDETTYDTEHLKHFAEEYEQMAKAQMERVTGVIDVHK